MSAADNGVVNMFSRGLTTRKPVSPATSKSRAPDKTKAEPTPAANFLKLPATNGRRKSDAES